MRGRKDDQHLKSKKEVSAPHRTMKTYQRNESPEPPPPPNKPTQCRDELPSVELEGERKVSASINVGLTSAEMDTSGAPEDVENDEKLPKNLWNVSEHADKPLELRSQNDLPKGASVNLDDLGDNTDASPASWSVEDVGKRLNKLHKAVKHIRKRLEQTSQENSPDRPGEEPENPGGEAVVPGGTHSIQEHPRSVRNEHVNGTNSPCQDRAPRGCRIDQVESRGAEGVWDCKNVVDHARYNGTHPRSEENERDGGMDVRTQETGPLGHRGEQVELGGNEGDRERQSDGYGDKRGGR